MVELCRVTRDKGSGPTCFTAQLGETSEGSMSCKLTSSIL